MDLLAEYLEDDAGSTAARIDVLRRQLATSRQLMVRARERARILEDRLTERRAAVDALLEHQQQLQLIEADLRHALQLAEAAAAEREAAFNAEVRALQAEVAALRASFSWRVTRPLRAVTGAARRLVARARRLRRVDLAGRTMAMATRRRVARSGLFDPDWYRQAYPDVNAAGADPLTHFMVTGWREGRQPGPQFDLNYYRYAHPDVAKTGINPLLHYVLYGQAEGRSSRAVGQWRRPSQGFGAPRLTVAYGEPEATGFTGSIAVAVHAFYPDVFEIILQRLRHLPQPFTLYVSTPTEEKRRELIAAVEREGWGGAVHIRVTPNRGRNFGPLLTEFAGDLLRHDLVLHLHTKKSLHNAAGEQTAWRDDIFDALLGAQTASDILALFSQRAELGVLYPATFRNMAYWANHWLQNTAHAPALFARLGVGDYPTHGYIDYPVGGMFWARVEAIRPLLEAGFTYDDFPPEAGQTDGTLAHAIERAFVPLCRSRGFTFAESDPGAAAYRMGWSDKNLDRYELNTPAALEDAIAEAELVSFDLFDTLITRPSLSPDAVQAFVGRHIEAHHRLADFPSVRKAAEHDARAAKAWLGDVDLDDIYAAFPAHWPQAARDEARALEGEIEVHIALPRDPVLQAARTAIAAGKRVLVISDTYFDAATIDALLAKFDIGRSVEVVRSSAWGARKDRGDLWTRVMEREGVAPARWLHVGDNEVSDMQRAGDLGLRTFHVMNPVTLLVQKQFLPDDRRLIDSRGDALLLGPAAARLGADPFPEGGALGPRRITTAEELGYCVFGPLLSAFTIWVARQAQSSGLAQLCFLAREGWALQPLYDLVREACPDRPLPPSRYLYASRRAVLMAQQAKGLEPDVVLRGPAFRGTLGQLLQARLGLLEAEGETQEIVLPRDAELVRKELLRRREMVEAQAQEEASAMLGYLRAAGLAEQRAGVVDVGYRATIQKGLQSVLGRGLDGFYMGVFPQALQVSAGEGRVGAFFGEALDPLGQHPLVRHAILLEALLTSPEGQLQRFRQKADGSIEPHLGPATLSATDVALLKEMHAGVANYLKDLLHFYGPRILDEVFDPEAALEPVLALAEGRLSVPAEILRALQVEDAFCGYDTHEVGKDLAPAEVPR